MPAVPLAAIARVFLLLGTTAFGGPAAHIAMMHDQIVRRRGWLSDGEFADFLGATNLIPGPNSTELAIHVGRRVAGFPGLIVAGACFIIPSAVLVCGFAAAYVAYGRTPDARAVLAAVGPVIIAIIVSAIWTLSRSTLRRVPLAVIAGASTVLALAGVNELLLLGGGALAMLLVSAAARRVAVVVAAVVAGAAAQAAAPAAVTVPFTLTKLTLFFLKVGSVLFGSGYVLIAFLRADLVDRWHWLTDRQLLDAITVGQFTPGPLSTSATFIGYLLGGWPGAVLATFGMFLPGFVFVALTQPLIPRLRRSAAAGACLDGVVAASLGLMAAVALELGRSAITSVPYAAIALAALLALTRWRINSAWLVLAAALIGLSARA